MTGSRALIVFPLATATAFTAAPAAEHPAVQIAPGVRIGHVQVGGLTSEPARERTQLAFDRPLAFSFAGRTWTVSPARFGAGAAVYTGIERALVARPGTTVPLRVQVKRDAVRRYVAALDKRWSRPARNAELAGLVDLQPSITEAKPGVRVRRAAMQEAIVRALQNGRRTSIPLAVSAVQPTVTKAGFGPVIVIHRGSNQLFLYDGERPWRTFGVATGRAQYPTPIGTFSIVDMQRDPWWRPPNSDWAKGLKPIPPGPGNPLGTRWMGTSASGVGIHGTPDAASIGYSASHGCIRMHIPDAEWLFDHVHYGTPVVIVSA